MGLNYTICHGNQQTGVSIIHSFLEIAPDYISFCIFNNTMEQFAISTEKFKDFQKVVKAIKETNNYT